MPATHAVSAKLPAVSGSSGRLIVERPPAEDNDAAWPGRIFENPELPYADAMLAFVAAAQERASLAAEAANGALATEKRTLDRTEAQLRDARRQVREQRQLQDGAWQAARVAHRAAEQADQGRAKAARRPAKATVRRSGAHCATNAAPPWQPANKTMPPGGKHGWSCANAGRRYRSSAPGSPS